MLDFEKFQLNYLFINEEKFFRLSLIIIYVISKKRSSQCIYQKLSNKDNII